MSRSESRSESPRSETESADSLQEIIVDLPIVLAALKKFDVDSCFKVIKAATLQAEKIAKGGKMPKDPDAPKGPTPKQLLKSTGWVDYTMEHAIANGWEEFVKPNRKDGDEVLMPASVEKNGAHTYPDGKPFLKGHAMCLSKQRWSPKAKEGTHEELYNQYSAEFDARKAAAEAAAPIEEAEEVAAVVPVRKTLEAKAKELADAKAALEEKKADAKRVREAAAAQKKQDAAAAAAAEKQRKADEKTAAKALAAKAPAAKAKVSVVVKVKATAATAAAAMEPETRVKSAPKKKAWTCADDGQVHAWTWKKTNYLRNFANQVWLAAEDGACGDWCGVYVPEEDKIDESVADPYAPAEEAEEAEEADSEEDEDS
jgi:hypothetical protein